MTKKTLPFHPLLFALLPIVSLLSFNINSVPVREAIRPAAISLVVTIIIIFTVNRIVKDYQRTGIISSLFLILFFSYGHVYGGYLHATTNSLLLNGKLAGRHDYLLVTWSLAMLTGSVITIRLTHFSNDLTKLFNLIAIVAFIMPVYNISKYELNLQKPWPHQGVTSSASSTSVSEASNVKPDIYYIILDGYGREDTLNRYYGFDNSDFVNFLENAGFFVAKESRSNYLQTALSLSSSLNMQYLDFLSAQLGDSPDQSPTSQLIRHNEARQFLETHGYQTVAFSTGYRVTEFEDADIFLRPDQNAATSFDRLVMDTSALILYQEFAKKFDRPQVFPGYEAHRQRILFELESLSKLPQISGPKFVFVHIVAPHPPFVFQADGEPVKPDKPFYLLDGSVYPGTQEEYRDEYPQQVAFINSKIELAINDILAKSDIPPIIVVQGDHGPGSNFDWDSPSADGLIERSSILNAYYLSNGKEGELYETISPVNTFRVIFNQYFGSDFPLLADKAFYSSWNQPYIFTEIK